MRANPRELLGVLIAGAVTGLGYYLSSATSVGGSEVVAAAASTSSVGSLVSAIGTNWLSSVGTGLWARACRRQLSEPGWDLRPTLERALRRSADQLEAEWNESATGREFRQGPRGAGRADEVAEVFQALRDGVAALDAARSEDLVRGAEDALLFLDGDEAAIRQALRERLMRGLDLGPASELTPVVQFIADNLGAVQKVALGEALRAPGSEGEQARHTLDTLRLHELRDALERARAVQLRAGTDPDAVASAVDVL